MVPVMCVVHEHRLEAVSELDRRLDSGQEMVVAGHSVVETYAVLTRLPPPNRLSALDAWRLIKENFVDQSRIMALDADEFRVLLDRASEAGIAGGQVYDFLIAECARRAGVDTLLTFNSRHFLRLADSGVRITVPGNP